MSWNGFAGAWNRWWHAPASPVALGVFRILFAYCLFREVATTRGKALESMASDAFQLPYVDWIPHLSPQLYELVHGFQYPIIVLFGLGIFTRSCCVALLFLQGWVFFADQLVFRNHPYFFLLVLLVLAVGPAGRALSVESLWRHRDGPWSRRLLGEAAPRTSQRLIQAQVALVYVVAGLHKIHPYYLAGDVAWEKVADEVGRRTSGEVLGAVAPGAVDYIVHAFWPWPFMAATTVVLELTLPFLLWCRASRRVAMVLGLGFHAGIAFIMDISVFSYAMMATYLLFADPATIDRGLRRAGGWLARHSGLVPPPALDGAAPPAPEEP